MNTVNLIGRLTKDPELRKTQNGTSVCSFTLAVDREGKHDEDGPSADFISCVAWQKTAELLCQYMHKGSRIGLCGRIQTRNYDNDQGQKVYVTEVVANRIDFCDSKKDSQQQGYNNGYPASTSYTQPGCGQQGYSGGYNNGYGYGNGYNGASGGYNGGYNGQRPGAGANYNQSNNGAANGVYGGQNGFTGNNGQQGGYNGQQQPGGYASGTIGAMQQDPAAQFATANGGYVDNGITINTDDLPF